MLWGLTWGLCPGVAVRGVWDAGGTASPCPCRCRDWANWESPTAGSAPGDGVRGETTAVTVGGKGQVQFQAAWQPFIPSCQGGTVGHRVGWRGEDEQHCTKIHINNLIRPKKKKSLPAGIHQGELSGSNNKESRSQPAQ